MASTPPCPYVSRGGLKLQAALDAFDLDPTGQVWADFGCNVGGFTDCLLQRGASKVFAIDTGYGQLAWTLRKDDRVVVMERTNALHVDPPGRVDGVAIDAGWTCQDRIVPAAGPWLDPAGPGWVVSLLKPHYEWTKLAGEKARAPLSGSQIQQVLQAVSEQLDRLGWAIQGRIPCPIVGKGGNTEWLILAIRNGLGVDANAGSI
jgi:23S rRNA (cytidine1920-2'-O)/16S rRNA (cytidine1409-2'-O)-methyltransferase